MDEKNLIMRAKENDTQAFTLIVEKYKTPIFNICYHYLSNYHDADDAAQETFVKVFKSINNFHFASSFSTYITRIAINTCKDYYKKHKKSQNNINIDDENTPEISDNKNIPDEDYELKERQILVRNAIAKLNKNHREVIILRDLNGYSYEQIAKVLNVSEGTVKSRINRARLSLKEIILKDGTFL